MALFDENCRLSLFGPFHGTEDIAALWVPRQLTLCLLYADFHTFCDRAGLHALICSAVRTLKVATLLRRLPDLVPFQLVHGAVNCAQSTAEGIGMGPDRTKSFARWGLMPAANCQPDTNKNPTQA